MSAPFTQSFSFATEAHRDKAGIKLAVRDLSLWYGEKQALHGITLDVPNREVTALIGPSGCGKTTLIKCFNRIAETIPGVRITGDVLLDGASIHAPEIEPGTLRQRIGWVAQQPNPFPRSIYFNVAYGAQLHGRVLGEPETDALVEGCLREVGLWDEVKDRLQAPAPELSGGQQQRLCIARALATNPEVLLMDEPCSALDPTATRGIEALIDRLRTRLAIVIITHNLGQAARVSQMVAFLHQGALMECGPTRDMLVEPHTPEARAYLAGRFG